MRRILVLRNPEAGSHNSSLLEKKLERHLTGEDTLYEIHTTRSSDYVKEIVKKHLESGFNLFIAAGGDGTVAAVAGGLLGSDIPLGIIPLGTGNMLARELKIPLGIERATRLIAGSHRLRTIDAMELGGSIFLLNIGAGISSLAVKDLSRKEKRIFGLLAYVGSAIKQIVKFKPHRFSVTVDGEPMRIRSPEVSISNGGIISNMILPRPPEIEIDDGALDVIYIKADSIRDYPALFLNVLGRKPPESSIRCVRARKRITIDAEKPIAVQADGEIVGETPISVGVLPAAFRVIVPKSE